MQGEAHGRAILRGNSISELAWADGSPRCTNGTTRRSLQRTTTRPANGYIIRDGNVDCASDCKAGSYRIDRMACRNRRKNADAQRTRQTFSPVVQECKFVSLYHRDSRWLAVDRIAGEVPPRSFAAVSPGM